MKSLLIGMLALYKWFVSPFLHFVGGPGCGCRFDPSCSDYAMEAVKNHGAFRGGMLALKRICRCHPWGGCGTDPVPPVNRQLPPDISPDSN